MKTMKKLIAISLTVVMLFAMSVPSVAHVWYSEENNTTNFIASEDKEMVVNAGKLPDGATVELGKSDSDWQYAYPYTLNKLYNTKAQYHASIDADVYIMYDANNIYIKEVYRSDVKQGDFSAYTFLLSDKELSEDINNKTPVGAYVKITYDVTNAEAGTTAVPNTITAAKTTRYAWYMVDGTDDDGNTIKVKDNTKTAEPTYVEKSDFSGTVSYSKVDGETFVVETAIPWSGIGDGSGKDLEVGSLVGFKHRVSYNGNMTDDGENEGNSGFNQVTSLSNSGTAHTAGATTYHNEWDNFTPMYLRAENSEASTYAIDTSWYNTTDTEFELKTVGQLRGLSCLIATASSRPDFSKGKTFKLAANMDLNPGWSSDSDVPPLYMWIPMAAFSGTFDGQGYTISNVVVDGNWTTSTVFGKSASSVDQHRGFIAFAYNTVVIENLSLEDTVIESKRSAAGLIAVVMDGATVEINNVYVDAKVTMDTRNGSSALTNQYAGILIGHNRSSAANSPKVENAVCTGSLDISLYKDTTGNGSGPVWGSSNGASGSISNVLVMLSSNTATAYDTEGNTINDSYRTKYIATAATKTENDVTTYLGSWTEENTVYANPSTGALTKVEKTDTVTMNIPNDYPTSWVNVNDENTVKMPATVAEMVSRNLWIQETAVDESTNTFKVRVLTVVDSCDWDKLDLKVEVKVGDADFVEVTEDLSVGTVYGSILAADETLTASKLGGKYIGGVVLSSLSASGTVTLRITPVKYVGETAYANAHASTVTYIDGVAQ